MIEFLKELLFQFRLVTPESFHEMNRKQTVVYPYVVYDFEFDSLDRNVDGVYIDVDIFDNSDSYAGIMLLEDALRVNFKDKRKFTDNLYLRFNFLRSSKVPTGNDNLKRRTMQFYCKIDWGNK